MHQLNYTQRPILNSGKVMSLWDAIAENISAASGQDFRCQSQQAVSGGCINNAHTISNGNSAYFVKTNNADKLDMFEAEAAGLNEIAASNSIKTPHVICTGIAAGQSYLVLEQLTLSRNNNHAQLGCDLARMHQHTNTRHGWYQDNTIGSTPQINRQHDSWIDFWREHRLGFQLTLAQKNGYGGRLQQQGAELLKNLEAFFEDYQPAPSLLHGDLWSGNYGFCNDGSPVIFDPAVYYGDRETDIAMTELFGGFSAEFYQAYENEHPLATGYAQR